MIFLGAIGLSSAIANHEKIRQIVLFNIFLWETKNRKDAQKINKIINSGIGRFLYLYMNFLPKVLLKKVFYDKKKLPKRVHKQYIYPFPNKVSRFSLLNIAKSLVGLSDWYQEQWENLDKLEQKPLLILWGTKDEFITMKYLLKWKKRLPNAVVKEFDCGHFVQEEKPLETIQEIKIFMTN